MQAGQSVGSFRVAEKLGAGGMGEVWRATDTRLGRQVALKLLPEDFALDPERHARFEREAKVLASLSHPNIAVLYGLEHLELGDDSRQSTVDGPPAPRAVPEPGAGFSGHGPRGTGHDVERAPSALHVLVMELVEGEDLARRLTHGAIPVEEATGIALQVASALEAAHEKGIVHRDLKPANVAVTPDGTVKVLDFGLAKAWETDAASSNPSLSPTITSRHTREGVVLGTAAYMSPEQARGKPIDRRTDIWAFGCLLYEMLTAKQAFGGETVTDVIAAVVTRDPDWSTLPANLRPRTLEVLRRCLEKDPKRRFRDIGDVRFELEESLQAGIATAAPAAALSPVAVVDERPTPRRPPLATWAGAALALLALGGAAVWLARPRPPAPQLVEFDVQPPADTTFYLDPERPGAAVVSPDGAAIAFTAESKGTFRLYVRPLASVTASAVPGTEGAQYPFWSPDSRSIGYFADKKLRRVQVVGGASPPVTICDAEEVKGASWGSGGVIVFAPSAGAALHRVAEAGGSPTPVTRLDPALKEDSHRHPRFLPDGRHFLYLARVGGGTSDNAVKVGSIDGGTDTLLVRSRAAATYASGHLLFLREGTLMAQRFDPSSLRLSGEAVPVAEDVHLIASATALAVFSASETGVLAFLAGGAETGRRLVWRDREGRVTGSLGDEAAYWDVALSPRGDQAAVTVSQGSGNADVWLYDIARGVRTRLTFDAADEWRMVWSPDGSTLAFSSNRESTYDLYTVAVGGTQPEKPLYTSARLKTPCAFSPDGSVLLFQEQNEETDYDIFTIATAGDPVPRPFIATANDQGMATFSPDGRWVAYASNESGHLEVYVVPYPGPGRKWQISTQGGFWPYWRRDGRQIYYRDATGTIQSVPVEVRGEALAIGMPKPVYPLAAPDTDNSRYAVSADGSRFLSIEPVTAQVQPPLTVAVNWTARLPR